MERWKKRSRRGERRILTVIAIMTILIVIALIAFYGLGPSILESRGAAIPVIEGSTLETAKETSLQESQAPNQMEKIKILQVSNHNDIAQPDLQKNAERKIIPFTIATSQPEPVETEQPIQ